MPEPEYVVYLTNSHVVGPDDDNGLKPNSVPKRIPLPLVVGHNRAERVVTSLRAYHGKAEFDIKPFPSDKYLMEQEQIVRRAKDAEAGRYGRAIQGLAREAIRCAKLVKHDPADLAPLTDVEGQTEHPGKPQPPKPTEKPGEQQQEPAAAGESEGDADTKIPKSTDEENLVLSYRVDGKPLTDEEAAQIPPLDRMSGDWVAQAVAARKLIRTAGDKEKDTKAATNKVVALKKARFRGRHRGMTMGIDNDGHMWRYDPENKTTFWYYLPSLDRE